ncbi:MAG: serine/threonine-protein kinase [Polyangiales bacterium]
MIGLTINGRYRVQTVIASGGMGRIYLAEQIPLGRPVALKVLHSRFTTKIDDPEFQRRFLLEASILSRLQHPNIVTLYDYGRIDAAGEDTFFMAMEYLAGDTLHARLRLRGALAPGEATGLARHIARGLREAHRQGVVHRDLKPSNVMLVPGEDGGESVKILDFGLVKVLSDDSEELTKEGAFLGSPRYMSPEQIAHGRVDLRTDVYSLGVILYQCLCGRTPFESENSVHILMAHLHNAPPPMRERSPGVAVPERLERFAMRCLEKDPAHRPATMDDFLRELSECELALGLSSGAANTGTFTHSALRGELPPAAIALATPPEAPKRRRLALPLAIGLLSLVAVGLGSAALVRDRGGSPPAAAPAAAAPPARFTLVIESSPPGAVVSEGGSDLGLTPLAMSVERGSVSASPRAFEVRAEGFATATLRVGDAPGAELRRLVVLQPTTPPRPITAPEAPLRVEAPAPPSSPRRPPRRPPRARPTTPDDDIRSHR